MYEESLTAFVKLVPVLTQSKDNDTSWVYPNNYQNNKRNLRSYWFTMKDVRHLQNVLLKQAMQKAALMYARLSLRNPNKFPLVVKYIGELQMRSAEKI